MTGIENNNTFTLYDACKASNVGFDYPEDSKANQLADETNKKVAIIGIQSLQRKMEQNHVGVTQKKICLKLKKDITHMI